MKYEKVLWALIAVLSFTIMVVQTDRLNQAQSRIADLEAGVK